MFARLRALVMRLWSRWSRPSVDVIVDERFSNPSSTQAVRVKRRLEEQRATKNK